MRRLGVLHDHNLPFSDAIGSDDKNDKHNDGDDSKNKDDTWDSRRLTNRASDWVGVGRDVPGET
jgi:hypothetical protein